MKNNLFREAKAEDFKDIFLLGFDIWGNGLNQEQYLQHCFDSSKYKKGTWYTLEHNVYGIVSAAIVYTF